MDYFEKYRNDVKKTWNGIKNILNVSKKKGNSIDRLVYKNIPCTSNSDKVNALNDFFVDIGSSVEAKIPNVNTLFSDYLKSPNPNSIFLKTCNLSEVVQIIKELKLSQTCGHNSFPTNFLKLVSDTLSPIFVVLINKSFSDGIFPELLKVANVVPIFKKNERYKCENYRPISLLSNISKIFEKVMYARISNFLEKHDSIYKYQFGFREKHSTTHALLSMVESIRQNLDNKLYTCGVFVDLEKAFDTVNHSILLKKMEYYGIRGISNSWLFSYLSNRTQFVSIGQTKSINQCISCGVPPGFNYRATPISNIYLHGSHKILKINLPDFLSKTYYFT